MNSLDKIKDKLSAENKERFDEGAAVKLKRGVSHSSCYRVLADLKAKNDLRIRSLAINTIENDSRNAFLISIKSRPSHLMFQKLGFEYVERHLSIDKAYKTSESSEHGLAALHYTETYRSKKSKETIVVHLYLNALGEYLYSDIKKTDGASKDERIIVNSEQAKQLQENLESSIGLLTFLFEEVNERYKQAKELVEKLELELSKLTERLNAEKNEETLNACINLADTFIDAVERLNQYSDKDEDLRGQYTLSMLDVLLKRRQEFQLVMKSAASQHLSTSTPEGNLDRPTREDVVFNKIYSSIMNGLEKLSNRLKMVQYDFQMLPNIKKNESLFKEINLLLTPLQAEGLKGHFDSENNKRLDRLSLNIDLRQAKHDEWGVMLLEKAILGHEFALARELFLVFSDKAEKSSFLMIFQHIFLLDPKHQKEKEEVMKILKDFHGKSKEYRSTVLLASREATYNFSKKDKDVLVATSVRDNLSIKLGSGMSMLFKAYCNNDLKTFEMLLQHGADPNSWAIYICQETSTQKEEVLSMFNAISYFCLGNYVKYLRLLVKHGASPSFLHNHSFSFSSFRKIIKDKNIFSVLQESFLQMSPENLAHCFSFLINEDREENFKLRRVFAQTINGDALIKFTSAANLDDKKKELQSILERLSPSLFTGYIIGLTNFSKEVLEKFSILKNIHKTLFKKLGGMTVEEFEKACTKLFTCEQKFRLSQKYNFAYISIMAYEFLLVSRCDFLLKTTARQNRKSIEDFFVLHFTKTSKEILLLLPLMKNQAQREDVQAICSLVKDYEGITSYIEKNTLGSSSSSSTSALSLGRNSISGSVSISSVKNSQQVNVFAPRKNQGLLQGKLPNNQPMIFEEFEILENSNHILQFVKLSRKELVKKLLSQIGNEICWHELAPEIIDAFKKDKLGKANCKTTHKIYKMYKTHENEMERLENLANFIIKSCQESFYKERGYLNFNEAKKHFQDNRTLNAQYANLCKLLEAHDDTDCEDLIKELFDTRYSYHNYVESLEEDAVELGYKVVKLLSQCMNFNLYVWRKDKASSQLELLDHHLSDQASKTMHILSASGFKGISLLTEFQRPTLQGSQSLNQQEVLCVTLVPNTPSDDSVVETKANRELQVLSFEFKPLLFQAKMLSPVMGQNGVKLPQISLEASSTSSLSNSLSSSTSEETTDSLASDSKAEHERVTLETTAISQGTDENETVTSGGKDKRRKRNRSKKGINF